MQHAILEAGTAEWHAERMGGVGGSDAAAALGLSRWKTPLDLYMEKTGAVDAQEETWEMARGKALEPLLRQHYADTTGREVMVAARALVHPKYEFMRYNPDGISADGRLQEFKTAAYGQGWGDEGTDEVPTEYLLQVQHGLIVTALEVADVTVSISGNRPKYFVVEADRELQEMIIDGEAKFWDRVKSLTPPEPINNADVSRMYSRVNGQSVIINPEIATVLLELRDVREQMKKLESSKESLEVQIKHYMGENEILVSEDGFTPLVTWKQQKGAKRIDSDLLRTRHPAIADECTKQGDPIRRFLLK